MPIATFANMQVAAPMSRLQLEAGRTAAQLGSNAILHGLRAQHQLATFWLGVGSEWTAFLRKAADAQIGTWAGMLQPAEEPPVAREGRPATAKSADRSAKPKKRASKKKSAPVSAPRRLKNGVDHTAVQH